MNENWMKLLATIACWCLVIVCAFPHRADGADHSATVDEILRSVAAVRAHLEPKLKNLFPQRPTEQPPMVRLDSGGPSGNRRAPGFLQLIRGAPSRQPPASTTTFAPALTIPIETSVGETKSGAPDATTVGPVERTTWSTTSKRGRIRTRRPVVPLSTTPTTVPVDDALRANPLGVIIPSPDQLNFFQQWQRLPYLGPSKAPSATSTSTTAPPKMVDFVFPRDSSEDLTGGLRPVNPDTRFGVTTNGPPRWSTRPQSSTSTVTPLSWATSTTKWLSSTSPPLNVTVDPTEQETTEPPEEEEGLGNRIDQKVLLSLVG